MKDGGAALGERRMADGDSALGPGATVGIMGGGQLGRMLAQSAAQLGLKTHIFAPEKECVAGAMADRVTTADWQDSDALTAFAEACNVVTYEFENVMAGPLAQIGDIVPLRPLPCALEVAQSRIDEKRFARECGGRTAPFAIVDSVDDLRSAIAEIGLPAILKTNRMGYDGKGQVRLTGGEDARSAWDEVGQQPSILEGFVAFEAEFSVVLARGLDGAIRYWDSPRNIHEDGILVRSELPAGELIEAQVDAARDLAAAMAERLGYVGVMTCEFFAGVDGPVFNEMAPRVHNSGHWTIEGAVTSQFENHIRAICGLPLGATRTVGKQMAMRNLLGAEANDLARHLSDPEAHLHLYGKAEARDGRKMGHVTWVK